MRRDGVGGRAAAGPRHPGAGGDEQGTPQTPHGSPGGEPRYYMAAELYFDSKEAMFAALGSPEGKAAAKDVMGFAGDLIHMMFANVDA
ncbi:MAG: EthD family reductase [Planctomycetes bacterium]|nr:EthD family reductase [Planctomycetota bacterium]